MKIIFITEPLKVKSSVSLSQRIFLKKFWLFLKEYILEHEKFSLFYIEFLLDFLYECNKGKYHFHIKEVKPRVITCEDALDVLKELIPKLLIEKNSSFLMDKTLLMSFVEKISSIYGKNTICATKSITILRSFFSFQFMLKEVIRNEEVLNYIFEKCFNVDTQHFFLLFLSLCFPKLNDESLFRNTFFDNVRKSFLSLMEEAENESLLETKIKNWKVKIFCKLFQNLLLSVFIENDFVSYQFQDLSQKDEIYQDFFEFNYTKVHSFFFSD